MTEHREAYLRIGLVMYHSLNYIYDFCNENIVKRRNALNIESVKKKHMNIVLKEKN